MIFEDDVKYVIGVVLNSQELVLESEHVVLRCQTWGDPNRPPLLALHGWLDSSSSFMPIGELIRSHYVVAPDLVGHACSQHLPLNMLYTLETHVLVLLCMLDKLNWKTFAILGHSLGGGIGLAIAAALSSRITHVIMLDKLGPPTLAEKSYMEQFRLNLQSRLRRSDERQVIYTSQAQAIEIRRFMSNCSEKTARLLVERDLMPVDGGFVSRSDRRLQFKSHRSITENHYQHLLEAVTCPTLLIKAESGMLKGLDLIQEASYLRDFRRIDVAGVHHVHMDEPEHIASIINPFLNQ